ncbi:MAG TPA: hypothetical protein VJ183_18635 [Chloroflexia bacterium]|nr:hypothetical protein [Chloroflexia bacterium]
MMQRIFVDFNTMGRNQEGRVLININAEQNMNKTFQPGMRVLLFEGETDVLEVEGVLELDAQYNCWWARPDWSTRRDYSVEANG